MDGGRAFAGPAAAVPVRRGSPSHREDRRRCAPRTAPPVGMLVRRAHEPTDSRQHSPTSPPPCDRDVGPPRGETNRHPPTFADIRARRPTKRRPADPCPATAAPCPTAGGGGAQVRLELRERHLAHLRVPRSCRIGFKSGEYFVRKRNQAPWRRRHWAARGLLWALRLSRMTTSPGLSVGASWVSTSASNIWRSREPSMTQGAVRPEQRRPAIKVWRAQRPAPRHANAHRADCDPAIG